VQAAPPSQLVLLREIRLYQAFRPPTILAFSSQTAEYFRYERVSEACEETKRLAKKWNLIGIILSQIARKNRSEANTEEEIREVSLYDGKESGSLENSCSVLLGMWKTSKTEMKCRVLKNTKGLAGNTVAMKIRGGAFIIEPA
jgi:hypothetical protein